MRRRFLDGEASALEEEALLELLLTYAIPRHDVAPIARRLMERFGSLAAVLAADSAALKKSPGISENTVVLLKLAARLREVAPPPESIAVPTLAITVAAPTDVRATITKPSVVRPANPQPVAEQPAFAMPCGTAADCAPDEAADDATVEPTAGADEDAVTAADGVLDPAWSGERKLQLSNGYSLESAQIARFLSSVATHPDGKKIPRKEIMAEIGLSYGQTEGLASICAALGLIVPLKQGLTAFGRLVVNQDLFLESPVTLPYCHFLAAGNPRNLVWHAVFNELLPRHEPMTQAGWCAWFRERLAGRYSDGSLVKHLAQEVRFLVDAYTVRNFAKLDLLAEMPDRSLMLRRSSGWTPPVLAAMIYTLGERLGTRLMPFAHLHVPPGSPGRLFGQDSGSLRQGVEALHQREWLRFEVRHGLDQIRLIDGFSALEFLAAAYGNRPPQPTLPPPTDSERLLL